MRHRFHEERYFARYKVWIADKCRRSVSPIQALIEENDAPQSEVFDRKRLCPLLDVVPKTARYHPRDVLGSDSRGTLLPAWNCYRRHLFPLLLAGHVASKLELPSL